MAAKLTPRRIRQQRDYDNSVPPSTGDVLRYNGSKFAPATLGSGGSDAHYVHNQSVPASVWTISHNLGKRPAVTALDSAGTRLFGEEEHPSVNQTILRFYANGNPVATGGTATCN